MLKDKLDAFLKRYNDRIDYKENGDNSFTLFINEKTQIDIETKEDRFVFFSKFAPLPKKEREVIFMELMKANFLHQGTGGGVIGIDKEEKNLTLFLSFPYEEKKETFFDRVEDFVNYLAFWREEVKKREKKGI